MFISIRFIFQKISKVLEFGDLLVVLHIMSYVYSSAITDINYTNTELDIDLF